MCDVHIIQDACSGVHTGLLMGACVRVEQLVEQFELHLHDNRCKMSMSH